MWPFRRRPDAVETRAASGFTAELIGAREAYIAGRSGLADLTATVQACVTLWEGGFALADVEGTDLLNRASMAMLGRRLALRGEALFLIGDSGLVPAVDWELSTRDGIPRAYRLSLPDAGGGRTVTALAAEVLHVRIGSDPAAPWTGTAPLRRAQLTAGLLQAVETALAEVYANAPIGSQIVPFPEMSEPDMERTARGFRGNRGRVLIRESVAVTAAGGPAPAQDWKANDVTPNLAPALPLETLTAARGAVMAVFGVLPGLVTEAAQGPVIREAQRHLFQLVLQPIALLIAEEATAKLGTDVTIDTVRPAQAFDAGGRARAFGGMVQALVAAKEGGLDPQAVEDAFKYIDWE